MTSTLPSGWVATTLGDLLREPLRNGYSKKPTSDSGLPILRISAVRPQSVRVDEVRYLSTDAEIGDALVENGDILFTRYNGSRAFVGVCGVVRGIRGKMAYPDKLIRARVHSTCVLGEWVAIAAHVGHSRAFIESRIRTTAGQSGVSGPDICQMPLPLPPLPEQRRIVEALETQFTRLDAAVATLERARAKLKRYRTAVLQSVVEARLGVPRPTSSGLPTGWTWCTIEDVASDVRFGSSAKTTEDSSGIPVLRMGNIQRGEIDLASLKYLPAAHHEFPDLLLCDGDLLFNRTNSPELVGKSAVFHGAPSSYSFASYLIRVRVKESCNPDFLACWLNSIYGRNWVKSVVVQQVGQANVNGTKLRAFRFAMPDRPQQDAIVAEVRRRFSISDAAESSVATELVRCERLRQSLLRLAFEGRLVPQDPRDEPASVFLDRIRVERAAARTIPKKKSARSRR